MRDLSVLIPARSEEWLARTVDDVLQHAEADTEVIVILDGAWPVPPGLREQPRLTVVHRPVSIGQRAATNEAARLSNARYVMKLDAHCSVAQGFDAELIRSAEELGPDVTQIPTQFNLHVYDQVCEACGNRTDQAPHLQKCVKCGAASFRHEVVWEPRKRTTSWIFDADLHFQYGHAGGPKQKGDIREVMTSLGACFFMTRERFWQIGGLDEACGSWGQYGVEIACKSWLSGGRHVVNTRTWFAHFFRVGGIGFPYAIHGSEQDRARQYSQAFWRGNRWPKQVHPLSWLVEQFWPVPGWTDEQLAELKKSKIGTKSRRVAIRRRTVEAAPAASEEAVASGLSSVGHACSAAVGGEATRIASQADADSTAPEAVLVRSGERVPANAMRLTGVVPPSSPDDVGLLGHEPEMVGIAARRGVADEMVENAISGQIGNEPCVHEAVDEERSVAHGADGHASVPVRVAASAPDPAPARPVQVELPEHRGDGLGGDLRNRERIGFNHDSASCADSRPGTEQPSRRSVPSSLTKGIVYYSDCRPDPLILRAARQTIERSGLPIVAVTLLPIDWPVAQRIVLPLERGILTMFRQILAGLEALDTDFAFLCEHDVLYAAPSHFEFTPERPDVYFYNENTWKVDVATGRALFYYTKQTSGLCAARALLVQHYRRRVARVEREGFQRAMGFEPGCHKPPRGVDSYPAVRWMSTSPNVDIRHGANLTPSRWRQEQFRSQANCQGWTEADAVPGWGRTRGRFAEILRDLAGSGSRG